MQSLEVRWPDHYRPSNCAVHVRNELDMDASLENVWAWLIRATLWPTWYSNSSQVKIIDGVYSDLHQDTRFRWKTFGVKITSSVIEYIPNERIAWDAHTSGLDAYHAWVLQSSTRGCHVLTEETQHGYLARLGKLFMPNRMCKGHDIWLAALQEKARSGLPPVAI